MIPTSSSLSTTTFLSVTLGLQTVTWERCLVPLIKIHTFELAPFHLSLWFPILGKVLAEGPGEGPARALSAAPEGTQQTEHRDPKWGELSPLYVYCTFADDL